MKRLYNVALDGPGLALCANISADNIYDAIDRVVKQYGVKVAPLTEVNVVLLDDSALTPPPPPCYASDINLN